jgi:hypothetical protein
LSIPQAFARIATAFSAAGLGPYVPAVARWPGTPVYDDGGSILTPGVPIAKDCMVQVDVATQAMRSEAGFVDTDVALLVLCASLDGELDTNATIIASAGPRPGSYSVQSVAKDSMSSHWICRGRAG